MKQSFLLAAAVALLFVVSSCSKKSSNNNSNATLGSVVFNYNGSSVKMVAVADTSTGAFVVTAGGFLPGSKDTAILELTCLYYGQPYPWVAQFSGTWADTANNQGASAGLLDNTTATEFGDLSPATSNPSLAAPFTVKFSTNTGSVVTGTFAGHLYQETGNQQDSLVIANGSFNLQL